MVVVLCTCPADDADRIAHAVVGQAVAACVNVVPGIRSIYRWQGEVHTDAEVLLLIKTATAQVAALSDALRAVHPYDTPEIVVLDVDEARSDPRYVAWVRAMTLPEPPR